MADSIVRLKVENSEYDAKIKRAAQGIQHLEEAAKKSGRTLDTLTKEEKNFVQSLGKMETVSRDARGRVNELTKAFADLSVQYNHMSDEAKKGEFGKEISKQLEILRSRAIDARKEFSGINASIGNGGGLNLAGMAGGAMKFAGAMGLAVSAADLFRSAITNNVMTAMEFEDSISKLSSLTGMVGKDLDTLKGYAIELGGSTTQSASQVAQAFMLIGSQKPELLKNSEALKEVTKAAITLGEAANIDVTEAAKALTASLNIMGEGADQATRYINVLAAGSKEGSVDIAGLTEVVFKAGQAAKMNKLSFEQLVAVAESIGPSFGSSAEAGTALNQMLLKLETQTNSRFKPSVVGLEKALLNLKDANLSAKDATKLVTETGYKALVPLLQNIDAVGKLQSAITGTNTAEDQAKTNTDNLKGSLANLSSAWERFNLTLNDSNGWMKTAVDWMTSLVNSTSDLLTETNAAADARERLNRALNSPNGNGTSKTRGQQIGEYNKQKKAADAKVASTRDQYYAKQHAYASGTFGTSKSDVDNAKKAWEDAKAARDALVAEGKKRFYSNTPKPTTPPSTSPTTTSSSTSSKTTTKSVETFAEGSIADLQQKLAAAAKAINEAATTEARVAAQTLYDEYKKKIDFLKEEAEFKASGKTEMADLTTSASSELEKLRGKDAHIERYDEKKLREQAERNARQQAKDKKNPYDGMKELIGGVSDLNTSLNALGIDLGEGFDQAISAINGIFGVIESVNSIITTINTLLGVEETAQTVALETLVGENAVPLFHNGGIVHAAQGVFVPGSPNGGRDTIPAMLSPGELVLNAAQQDSLAAQLQQGGVGGSLNLETTVRGEDLRILLNNNSRRRLKGEYLTSKGRR